MSNAIEMFTHDWNLETKTCSQPERVVITPLPKGVTLTVLLAFAKMEPPENTGWRAGYELKKGGERYGAGPMLDGKIYVERGDAITGTLGQICGLYSKDKPLVKALEAFYEKLGAEPPAKPAAAPRFAALPHGRYEQALRVSLIHPNPEQPRKEFDPVAMAELAASLSVGQLQPIAVRRLTPEEMGEFGEVSAGSPPERYELILGERRWRAMQILGRDTIEAKIYEGVTRAQGRAAALIENLQREGLNAIEEAEGYRDLMQTENLNQEECADRVGRKRPTVSNALRVLGLPEQTVTLIRRGKLTMAHGLAFARFKPKNEKEEKLIPNWAKVVNLLAEEAIEGKLTAATFEKGVPCQAALVKSGLGLTCHQADVGGTFPAFVKNHPAFERLNEWTYFCFEPAVWEKAVAEYDEEKKKEQAAEDERRRKAAEKAAKNPPKIKSLADLPKSSYEVVQDGQQGILSLVPASAVLEDLNVGTSAGGDKVTVCTKPELFKRIDAEVEGLKQKDRELRVFQAVAAARTKIQKLKKLGNRELLLLVVMAGGEKLGDPGFGEAAAKELGIKLPKAAFDFEYDPPAPLYTGEAFAALQGTQDPLSLFQVLMIDWLRRLFWDDAEDCEDFNIPADSDACFLLRWILERDDLGLMEESKAGQKQLLNAVKEQEWYRAAVAEIEGAEPKGKK